MAEKQWRYTEEKMIVLDVMETLVWSYYKSKKVWFPFFFCFFLTRTASAPLLIYQCSCLVIFFILVEYLARYLFSHLVINNYVNKICHLGIALSHKIKRFLFSYICMPFLYINHFFFLIKFWGLQIIFSVILRVKCIVFCILNGRCKGLTTINLNCSLSRRLRNVNFI